MKNKRQIEAKIAELQAKIDELGDKLVNLQKPTPQDLTRIVLKTQVQTLRWVLNKEAE